MGTGEPRTERSTAAGRPPDGTLTAFQRVDAWTRSRPWPGDLALALAIALALGPSSAAAAARAGPWAPTLLVVLGVGHTLVAVRRLVPRAAFGVTTALMALLLVVPDVPLAEASGPVASPAPPLLLPSALVFHVQLYTVASRTAPPWPAVALTTGVVGAGAATVRLAVPGDWLTPGTPPQWWPFALASLVASVLAAWGLGRFRATRTAYVAALEERARRAEADRAAQVERAAAAEREHVAREMHDVVAHSLAVMVRQAEGGRRVAATAPDRAVIALEVVAQTGREALADMRAALGALRPADGSPGPQPGVDDVPTLVEGMVRAGVAVDLEALGSPGVLDRAVSLAVYRVVQESLTNVAKHAPRAGARVRLEWSPHEIEVTVTDDGVGRAAEDSASTQDGPGLGLAGMAERVRLAGGTFGAGPAGRGFRVHAVLPQVPTSSGTAGHR